MVIMNDGDCSSTQHLCVPRSRVIKHPFSGMGRPGSPARPSWWASHTHRGAENIRGYFRTHTVGRCWMWLKYSLRRKMPSPKLYPPIRCTWCLGLGQISHDYALGVVFKYQEREYYSLTLKICGTLYWPESLNFLSCFHHLLWKNADVLEVVYGRTTSDQNDRRQHL